MEFAVLTVLISVQVNDSALSMGTHYRVWMGEWQRSRRGGGVGGERARDGACKFGNKIEPAVFIRLSSFFALTLNPFLFFPHFLPFFPHKSLLLFSTHLNLV